LTSADSTFTKVRISVVDDRLINRKVVKEYVSNSNMGSRAILSLSYCFPREDVSSISLTIGRENSFLEEGRQWGSVQIMIKLAEYDFPIQTANHNIKAILNIPESVLDPSDVDPNSIDISMVENNVSEMRDMALRGDLADETETIKEKTQPTKYSKSVFRGPRGIPVEAQQKGWEFMEGARLKGIDEQLQSQDEWSDTDSVLSGHAIPIQLPSSWSDNVYKMNREKDSSQDEDQEKRSSVRFSNVPANTSNKFKKTRAYNPRSSYVPKQSHSKDKTRIEDIHKKLDNKFRITDPNDEHLRFP